MQKLTLFLVILVVLLAITAAVFVILFVLWKHGWRDRRFVDEHGRHIPYHLEDEEREDAVYIPRDSTVLEIGARYGTVSFVINERLNDRTKHVVIEPDARVWDALQTNKKKLESEYTIVHKVLASRPMFFYPKPEKNGYGSSTCYTARHAEDIQVDNITYAELKEQTGLTFDTVVIDCEGCIQQLFTDFPDLLEDVNLVLYEQDKEEFCNYSVVEHTLRDSGFRCVKKGYHSVWAKEESASQQA